MSKVVRYGLIGAGNQGTYYAKDIINNGVVKNAKITAVCDNNPAKLKRISEILNNDEIKYFDNYIDLLDSNLVDAILIETPHYFHPEIAIEALKRNIHVLCDKPAGVTSLEVRKMNEESLKHDCLFTMMFNQRTNSLYKKAKELVEEGKLGKLQRVTWIITDWFRTEKYYKSGDWRATWDKEGGGVLINQCPHQLDLLLWIVNKNVKSVRSFNEYGKFHNIEVEDESTSIIEFEDGVTGVFVTSTGEFPGTNRLEISGTKGKILIDSNLDSKIYLYENEQDSLEYSKVANEAFPKLKINKRIVETDGTNPQHKEIIRNFTEAILGNEKLYVDGKEGIKQVELMNAMELSGWKGGEKVTLPLNEVYYTKQLILHRLSSKDKKSDNEVLDDLSKSFGTY